MTQFEVPEKYDDAVVAILEENGFKLRYTSDGYEIVDHR